MNGLPDEAHWIDDRGSGCSLLVDSSDRVAVCHKCTSLQEQLDRQNHPANFCHHFFFFSEPWSDQAKQCFAPIVVHPVI